MILQLPQRLVDTLEDEFFSSNLKTKFCLKSTKSDDLFYVGRAFFLQSAKLRNLDPFGENFEVNSTPATIQQFITLKSDGGEFSIPDHLNMIALNLDLGNDFWFRKCLKNYLKRSDEPLPGNCCSETVLRVFELLCNTVPRELEVYQKELARIRCFSEIRSDPDILTNAFNIVRERMEKLDVSGSKINHLEDSTLYFQAIVKKVMLVRRNATNELLMLRGPAKHRVAERLNWLDRLPNDLILDQLYIRYNDFILFRKDSEIWHHDLKNDNPPKLILEKCSFFVNRDHLVLAVIDKDSTSSSVVRIENDEICETVIEIEKKILDLDFDVDNRLLAIALDTESAKSVKFFEYEPFYLRSLKSNLGSEPNCHGVDLENGKFYITTLKNDVSEKEVYEVLEFECSKIDKGTINCTLKNTSPYRDSTYKRGRCFKTTKTRTAKKISEKLGLPFLDFDRLLICRFCTLP